MSIKATLSSCALACALLAGIASNASAVLISDLITLNQSITVGTLKFSNFEYTFTGDMPGGASVNVIPYIDGSGDAGLKFQGAFLDFFGGSGSDALIGFAVTELDPNKLIAGATLAGNPAVLGGNGIASVTETFLPSDTNLSLNIYAIQPGNLTKLVDSGTYAVDHTQVLVQKDVLAFSAPAGGGIPTLSFITQTFKEVSNPIPEPSSIILLGIGLTGLSMWRRRRGQ